MFLWWTTGFGTIRFLYRDRAALFVNSCVNTTNSVKLFSWCHVFQALFSMLLCWHNGLVYNEGFRAETQQLSLWTAVATQQTVAHWLGNLVYFLLFTVLVYRHDCLWYNLTIGVFSKIDPSHGHWRVAWQLKLHVHIQEKYTNRLQLGPQSCIRDQVVASGTRKLDQGPGNCIRTGRSQKGPGDNTIGTTESHWGPGNCNQDQLITKESIQSIAYHQHIWIKDTTWRQCNMNDASWCQVIQAWDVGV